MNKVHRQATSVSLSIEEYEQKLRKKIKRKLDENHLTQVWLISRLSDKGLNTDKAELSSVLSGVRRGAKVSALLSAADEILTRYERVMNNG